MSDSGKEIDMNVQLTQEEAKILDEHLFRKLVRLKESGLEDAICFNVFTSIRKKLREANRNE